ncbi:MAG: hypothetical protein ACJAW1_001738 [Glaciecola sp.]|jgi:hypothetical protein
MTSTYVILIAVVGLLSLFVHITLHQLIDKQTESANTPSPLSISMPALYFSELHNVEENIQK